MTDDFDVSQGKTAGDLTREAMWFALHTLFAVLVLCGVLCAVWLTHPDPDATNPKILGTLLAFFIPAIFGFIITKSTQDKTARFIWISGLLTFTFVCVWVLDLPTGNGLCEKCGAVEKLYRTFFDINHGSGLMGGDGLLVGTWLPLAMIGYSLGARFGIEE